MRESAKGYGWPKFGGNAEIRSAIKHSAAVEGVRFDGPPATMYEDIMAILLKMYKTCSWEIPSDFLSYEHFKRVVKTLDASSSPGYPYLRQYANNGQMFGLKEGEINEEKAQFWYEVVKDKIAREEADPIRLFIKPEPHKDKKIQSETYRLISSVSVLDQIIDHMLFDEMNDIITDNWDNVPSKVGWSSVGGGYRYIPRQSWMALDKSKWDWSARLWLFEMDLDFRARLCKTKGELFDRWVKLSTIRYLLLFKKPTFISSSGIIFRQLIEGVMKSGCVNTFTSNSVMQVILHIRVCLELGIPVTSIYALGDDTLQEIISQLLDEYLDLLGQFCVVKFTKIVNEFGGSRFNTDGSVEPLYKGKHAFNLLHMNPKYEQEIADSYSIIYHRSRDRNFVRGLFEEMQIELPTVHEVERIWEGEE